MEIFQYRTVRREKKWFERQGQGGDGEEGGGENTWCWPEGEDPISSLPKEVTIKVRVGAVVIVTSTCTVRHH